MVRIGLTLLLIAAWHFPTTFFAPSGAPNERGWVIWPFGQQSRPVLDGLVGMFAPSTLPATNGTPTLALVAASVASLAFLVALAAVWGIVVPSSWWPVAAMIGATASVLLFAIYLSPLALIPLLADAVLVWGIATQGWARSTLAGG
jgi:hypothetical protein